MSKEQQDIISHLLGIVIKETKDEEFQVVQWLRFCALTAEGLGLTPGWGARIHRPCGSAKKKKKDKCW